MLRDMSHQEPGVQLDTALAITGGARQGPSAGNGGTGRDHMENVSVCLEQMHGAIAHQLSITLERCWEQVHPKVPITIIIVLHYCTRALGGGGQGDGFSQPLSRLAVLLCLLLEILYSLVQLLGRGVQALGY